MNKQKYELFPTLVSKYEGVLSSREFQIIHEYCLSQETYSHPVFKGNSTSSHKQESNGSENILEKLELEIPELRGIIKKIYFALNDYTNDLGIRPVNITNNWFNIQGEGSILQQHMHCRSVLSAALYLNVDTDSSTINFENPNPHISYAYGGDETRNSEYLFEYYYLIPQPGDLIIFPSWLKHGSMYKENKTVNRTCISFNTK